MNEVDHGKRSFLGWLFKGGVTALMASVLYPIYKYVIPPASAEANISQLKLPFKLADLSQAKEAYRIFKFGRELGILVVTPNKEVKAFSALCTHLDCTVQYRDDMGVIWCACHNGHYDLEGRNIAGPPPRPLEQYDVHIDESTDDIFVSKMT
ncbi:MAG: ubiquinol-cytochrome c reductase iron-sulfur subunit [FCB group bacterium]|nr:ubiquinol-cytochrome c reductase iron-sulfur subunit [FCB group bacterium]